MATQPFNLSSADVEFEQPAPALTPPPAPKPFEFKSSDVEFEPSGQLTPDATKLNIPSAPMDAIANSVKSMTPPPAGVPGPWRSGYQFPPAFGSTPPPVGTAPVVASQRESGIPGVLATPTPGKEIAPSSYQIGLPPPPSKKPLLMSTKRTPEQQVIPATDLKEPTFAEARSMAAKQVSDAVDENLPFLVGPFRFHAGLIKGGAQMVTDPVNLAIMAGTAGLGAVPGVAARAMETGLSAYFATQAGKAFLQRVPQVAQKVKAGDWQGAAEEGGGALADAVMAYGAASHALGNVRGAARVVAPDIRALMDEIDQRFAGQTEPIKIRRMIDLAQRPGTPEEGQAAREWLYARGIDPDTGKRDVTLGGQVGMYSQSGDSDTGTVFPRTPPTPDVSAANRGNLIGGQSPPEAPVGGPPPQEAEPPATPAETPAQAYIRQTQKQNAAAEAWRSINTHTPVKINTDAGNVYLQPFNPAEETPNHQITDAAGNVIVAGPAVDIRNWLDRHITPQSPVAPQPGQQEEETGQPEKPATRFNTAEYAKAHGIWNKATIDAAGKFMDEHPEASFEEAKQAIAGTVGREPKIDDYKAPPPPPEEPKPVKPPKPPSPQEVGHTAGVPTAPESPETYALQIQQLQSGQRRVVMFPQGQGVPDLASIPPGLAITHDDVFGPDGTKVNNVYLYRPGVGPGMITPGEIRSAAKQNRLSEILGHSEMGMGAPDKTALQGEPIAVTGTAPDGTEAQTTVTDAANLPQTVAATHGVTPPGGTVEVKSPEQALGERQGTEPAMDEDTYQQAVALVRAAGKASTSTLQRNLRLGYGAAARMLDRMHAEGIIGPANGSAPREILSSAPEPLHLTSDQVEIEGGAPLPEQQTPPAQAPPAIGEEPYQYLPGEDSWHVLQNAMRPVRIGGEIQYHPDPIAMSVLRSLSKTPRGLRQFDTLVGRLTDQVPTFLGAGFDHAVIDLHNGQVLKVGKVPKQALSELELSPTESGAIGNVGYAVYPKLDTSGITEQDVAAIHSALAEEGLKWSDAGTDNLGRDQNGQLRIIDGPVTRAPAETPALSTPAPIGGAPAPKEVAVAGGFVELSSNQPGVPNVRIPVKSGDQASAVVRAYIDKHQLGSSTWTGGALIDAGGNQIGHVSYNGRVWDNNNQLLQNAFDQPSDYRAPGEGTTAPPALATPEPIGGSPVEPVAREIHPDAKVIADSYVKKIVNAQKRMYAAAWLRYEAGEGAEPGDHGSGKDGMWPDLSTMAMQAVRMQIADAIKAATPAVGSRVWFMAPGNRRVEGTVKRIEDHGSNFGGVTAVVKPAGADRTTPVPINSVHLTVAQPAAQALPIAVGTRVAVNLHAGQGAGYGTVTGHGNGVYQVEIEGAPAYTRDVKPVDIQVALVPKEEPAPPTAPAQKSWKYELQIQGEGDKWHQVGVAFPTKEEAEQAGNRKFSSWMMATDMRVVESDEPANYNFVDGELQKITAPPAPTEQIQAEAFPPTVEDAPADQPGHIKLANAVLRKLQNEEAIGNNAALQAIADQAFGGSRASGKYALKEAHDAVEAAVNRYIADSIGRDLLSSDFKYALGRLRDLLATLPTQSVRTDQQVSLQQFSTPPTLAFFAAVVANISPRDIMGEPSAGTAGLAAFAKAAGAIVHVNEIDPKRRELLDWVLRGTPATGVDAEILNATWPQEIQPTVFVMNPPFSATGGRVERNSNDVGYRHVINALSRLQKGGRLVAILGEGARMDAPNARGFWRDIAKRGGLLRANVGLSGEEYRKYGTTFGNRLIVIDKANAVDLSEQLGRPASVMPIVGDFDTIEEAYDAIQPIIGERSAIARPETGGAGLAETGGELPAGPGGRPAVPGQSGDILQPPQPGPVGGGLPERRPGAGAPVIPAGQPGTQTGNAPAATPEGVGGRPPSGDIGAGGVGAAGAAGLNPQDLIDRIKKKFEAQGLTPAGPEIPADAPPVPISQPPATPRRTQPAPAPTRPTTPLDEAAAEARRKLREKLGLGDKGTLQRPKETQGAVDPDIIESLTTIGAQHILGGKTSYNDWARAMVEEEGDILAAVATQARMPGESLLQEIHRYAAVVGRHFGIEAEQTPSTSEDESIQEPPREDDRVAMEATKQEDLLARVEDDDAFVQYVPAIQGLAHPGVVVESKIMASASGPPITYKPNLPAADLARAPKPLSAVQMEAIARAGQAHETFNEAGERLALLIADSTGLGKGQEIAGIIWDNNRNGRKRALWVSASKDLIGAPNRDYTSGTNATGDFIGIGATDLSRQLRAVNDWNAREEIDLPEGVLFSTYTTLAMDAPNPQSKSRRQQVMDWLGPDGVIVFDESAKLKGAVPGEQATEGTKAGRAGVEIQRDLPNARVVYVSATAATEIRNLGYMTRLGIWGRGTPFHTGFQQFMAEVGNGGIAAMELIARELKVYGRFLSRSISYKGVTFEEKIHDLTPEQEKIYDSAAEAWQNVLEDALNQVDENGGSDRQKRALKNSVWGEHQRFFRALLTAMKTPTLFDMIDKALADPDDPRAIIVSLIGTGEAQGKRQLQQITEENDDLDFSPREILINVIRRSYPVHMMEEYTDPETGETGTRYVTGPDGKPLENPEAVAKREAWIKQLSEELALPESPLDQIINTYGRDQVSEVTGRKKTIRRNPDTGSWEAASRAPDGVRMKDINTYEMNQFQDGKKNILVISKAGGTGFSFQAALDRKNQRRRLQIALELSWSADDQTQAFGRSHRSNQRVTPEFIILSTNAGGEKRFSSSIARRLESLGALSKGQRDASGGSSVLAKYNFETDQGLQAVESFYNYLLQDPEIPGSEWNGLDILRKMGVLDEHVDEHTGEVNGPPTVSKTTRENVTRLLNRILNVQIRAQNGVFELFTHFFDEAVAAAIEAGRLDTGVNLVRGDHVRLTDTRVIATDPKTNANTYRYVVEVERKNKPVPVEFVQDLHERGRGHMMRRREDRGDGQPDQLIWSERSNQPITTRGGAVERAYRIFGPGHRENARDYRRISESDLNQYYEPMEGADSADQLKRLDDDVKATQAALDKFEAEEKEPQPTGAPQRLTYFQGYQDPGGTRRKKYYNDQIKSQKQQRKDLLEKIKKAREGQWEEWQKVYDAAPQSRIDRIDMIGGSVMRIWSHLNVGRGRMDIRIAYPESGGSITGVVMSEGDANNVESTLTGRTLDRTPESVYRAALSGAERFTLVGGLRLQQGRINRQPVVDVIGADMYQQRFLKDNGVKQETVNYRPRYYIPNDERAGIAAVTAILKQFPLITNGRNGQTLARPRTTPGAITGPVWTFFRPRADLMDDAGATDTSKADATYEKLLEGHGHVYANRTGMDLIANVIGKSPSWGFTMDETNGKNLLARLNQIRLAPAFANTPVARIIKAVEQALADDSILTVVEAGQDTPVKEIQATRREEAFHRHQIKLGMVGDGGSISESLLGKPDILAAVNRISAKRGYGYDDQIALIEIGAMLGTGQGADIGLDPAASAKVFRQYVDSLIDAHGPEAGTILKMATPQVRRALGNDYVRARWNGNYKADAGATGGNRRDQSIESADRPEGNPVDTARQAGLPHPVEGTHARATAAEGVTARPKDGERGSINLGNFTLGLDKLFEQDIIPAAKTISTRLSGGLDDLKRVFAPQTRGPIARRGAGVVRERGAEIDQRRDRAVALLKGFRDHFYKDFQPDGGFYGLDVWDAIETGQTATLSGADIEFAKAAKSLLDPRTKEIEDLGIVKTFIEDYLPRAWKVPQTAESWIRSWLTKRPMAGPEHFRRQRKFPTMKEGIDDPDFTLVPKFDNPVDMLLDRIGSMDQSITAHQAFEEMHDKGDLKYVRYGVKPPIGWRKIDDKLFTVVGPRFGAVILPEGAEELGVEPGDVRVLGGRTMGHYYAPEPLAQVVNNHLSQGVDSSGFVQAWRGGNNFLNMVELTASYYHGMTTTLNSSLSDMALGIEQALAGRPVAAAASVARGVVPFASVIQDYFKGTKIQQAWDMQPDEFKSLMTTDPLTWAIVDTLKAAGGKARQDLYYQIKFVDGMKKAWETGNPWGAAWRLSFAALETAMKPIMEYMVPRVKLGAFAKLAAEELQHHPTATRDEARAAYGQIWNSIDNRFGQLAQRNMLQHALARGAMNAVVGRPGWNIGSAQELVGGLGDLGKNLNDAAHGRTPRISHKSAYLLALLLGGAFINGLASFFLSKNHQFPTGMDFIAPRDGGLTEDGRESRIILPMYLGKDIYSYATRPLDTLKAKAAPILSLIADLIQDRDFNRNKIYGDRSIGLWHYLMNEVTPYSVSGIEKNLERGASLGKTILPTIGIMPAGKRVGLSPAERMITEYQDEQRAMTRAPSTEHSKAMSKVLLTAKRGDVKQAQAVGNAAVAAGQMSPADVRHSIDRAKETPLLADYKRINDFPTAMRIFDAANEQEKVALRKEARAKAYAATKKPWLWNRPDGSQDKQLRTIVQMYFGFKPYTPYVPPRAQAALPTPAAIH